MEKFNPYHRHLIIKGYFLEAPKEVERLNRWFIELVELVGMKVVAGPTSVYINEFGNEGMTGNITLSTSHASLHVWDNEIPSLFQFDLYSCKDYDTFDVIGKLDEFKLE
jgi:S-adenosylmethionine/arginine decarboxylase-like enzyme